MSESPYAGKSLLDVIYDFGHVRGDLTEEYARRQMHRAILESHDVACRIAEAEERGAAKVRERVEALHSGLHVCTGGTWWTDDPTYRGDIARVGKCPTRAALTPEAVTE